MADNETYSVIDLETTNLIPLLPLSQAGDSSLVKPLITVVGESEFLLLSWTGSSTLGLFITGKGDPVRGTLTWNTHPNALCTSILPLLSSPRVHANSLVGCDYPYVTSLLPNGNIEVHELETQSICQVLPPTQSAFSPIALVKSTLGFLVPRGDPKNILETVNFPLIEPDAPNTSEIEEKAAGSGHLNSHASAPGHDNFAPSSTTKQQHRPRQLKSSVLAVGSDAIYALTTPTLIQQIDMLLECHKLGEATNLVKEHQRKLEQKKRASHSQSVSDIEAQVPVFPIRPPDAPWGID